MLRLAHRILSQRPAVPPIVVPQAISLYETEFQRTRALLATGRCPVIIADNVASYYADTSRQDWGLTGKNYPCVAPPFKHFWLVEWNEPDHLVVPAGRVEKPEARGAQGGALFLNVPVELARPICEGHGMKPDEFSSFDAKWFLISQGIGFLKGQLCYHPFKYIHFIKPSGELLTSALLSCWVDPHFFTDETKHKLETQHHIPLLTLGFLHCKNVTQLDVTNEEGPSSKWCRRQRVPELKYHALQIDPNLSARPRSNERKTEGDRSGKALHICRGHFAHYVDDGVSQGLFGRRQFGTFWVPAHTRGSLEHGQVVSTYNVKAPVSAS